MQDIGAIIPKIEVRDYIPDPSLPKQPPNPITLHVYPGKDSVSYTMSDLQQLAADHPQTYNMYLDDGISRDSAPCHYVPHTITGEVSRYGVATQDLHVLCDEKAADKYCHVLVEQVKCRLTSLLHFSADESSIC